MPNNDIRRTTLGHWVVDGDQGVSRLVEMHGTFDYPDNIKALAAVSLSVPEGGVVVDAGASIGDQTVHYAQMVGPTGMVYAAEPHPLSYRALARNTATLSNVTTRWIALGAVADTTDLTMVWPNAGASFLGTGPHGFPEEPTASFEPVSVDVTTLDAWLGHLPMIDFLHLDAEGMEGQILKGAEGILTRCQPTLFLEVTDRWLRRYGSSSTDLLQQIAGYGYLSMMRLQDNPLQFDVLAIPVSRQTRLSRVAAGVLSYAG